MSTPVEDLPHRHLFTVDEYCLMAERGLFAPEARTELIEGEIFDMAPAGNPHMAVVDQFNETLIRTLDGRAIVRSQGAVRLGDLSMPQPDILLLKRREDFYRHKTATAEDVLLLIEVSDSTLRHDLERKLPLYALFGIPEVWVINLREQQVHFFRHPLGKIFLESSRQSNPGATEITQLPGVAVDLSWLAPTF